MSTKAELIEKIKEVAAKLGTQTLTRKQFLVETGLTRHRINKFGEWRDLCEDCGLVADKHGVAYTEDEIFQEMRNAFIELRGITSRSKFERKFAFSIDVFRKRGMTKWEDALRAFRQWCENNNPDFPYLAGLPQNHANSYRAPKEIVQQPNNETAKIWSNGTGPTYGDFLNFRGLQHAPANEQGVVFLFGMVAGELGFAVEIVQTGYPDCEGKRRIKKNKWQKVRIEFEYQSRNFQQHGHDPRGCDVIVCWEHNWPDCPVEVLELREEIKKLQA